MMLTSSEAPHASTPVPSSGACLCPLSSLPQWRGHEAAQMSTEDGMGAGMWVTWPGPPWHPAEPRGVTIARVPTAPQQAWRQVPWPGPLPPAQTPALLT